MSCTAARLKRAQMILRVLMFAIFIRCRKNGNEMLKETVGFIKIILHIKKYFKI